MHVGIDASNIRAGGGITHLKEMLTIFSPDVYGVDRITVWGGKATLEKLPSNPHVSLEAIAALDGGLASRLRWQQFGLARDASICDVLLVPGGIYLGRVRPFVTMGRNLLPFDPDELRRLGRSKARVRLELVRRAQLATFARADGVIYPTAFMQDRVASYQRVPSANSVVIPHGLNRRFDMPPREQRPGSAFSDERPFKLLYVSVVDAYKHQWRIVHAVADLQRAGIPVALDLIGPANGSALTRLEEALASRDPEGRSIRYLGPVSFEELHSRYQDADGFIFASTSESFGQIVVEAMSAGLPIACSRYGASPEVLGNGGILFDPLDDDSTRAAIKQLVLDQTLRADLAKNAYERSHTFSWERCAASTFSYLADVAASSGAVRAIARDAGK